MTKRAILVLQMFDADMAFQTEMYSYHQLSSFVAIVKDVNGCIFQTSWASYVKLF